MLNKYHISLLFVFISLAPAFGQQEPIYSQYILNEFILNPAVAGVDGMTSLNLTGRKQWVGLGDTPETYSASASTRILKNGNSPGPGRGRKKLIRGTSGRVGLGASFISDRNGAISRTGIQLAYAYHIPLLHHQLSFGLSGQVYQFNIDPEKVDLQPDDPLLGLIGNPTYIPDAGAGINFSNHNFHLGVSAKNLLQSPIKLGGDNISTDEIKHLRQYYAIGTYRFNLQRKPSWAIETSVLVRAIETLQTSADFSFRVIYDREYWAGLSVRTSGDFIALLGTRVGRVYLGYSIDYGFNEISKTSYGSHEIVCALKLGDSTRRYRWWERY